MLTSDSMSIPENSLDAGIQGRSTSISIVVPGRVQNSSGSGSAFEQSSGSGLIGFLSFRKLRVFGFIGMGTQS